MMGLAKMAPDGWRYYADEIALGREDYFAGHGEEPGRWVGRGADALGLAGPVGPEEMSLLFGQGRHPGTGEALGRPFGGGSPDGNCRAAKDGQGGVGKVAGYALSFSPPKSISVLWALADEAVSGEVQAAQDAAVGSALEFLQDHAAFTRRGRGGVVQADTDGYLAAVFTHRTSRSGDPQLHTHVLLAAKIRASSDRHWLALDGRELFEVQKAAGLLYKAGLRAELSARLGVAWGDVGSDGAAEVAGVPAGLVEHFSTRRAQVEARAAQMVGAKEAMLGRSLGGGERAALFQLAAYRSRAAKPEGGETTGELRARWRREATEAGHDPDRWLAAALGPAPSTSVPGRSAGATAGTPDAAVVTDVLAALERGHSTWGRADVVEALALRVTPSAADNADTVRRLVEVASDELLAETDVVCLGAEGLATVPEVLRRRDGLSPTRRHGAARYSTWGALRAEQAILEVTEQGRDAQVGVVAEPIVEAAITGAGLGDDQAEAVRRLCQGGERVAVVVGPAGSGKSRSLAAARVAWEAAGVAVRGVAPSAVAAGVLTEQARIASETLAKFLLDAGRGRAALSRGEVVVCDEASMVSTADLAKLVDLVEGAGGKLVLVGDHHQLGAVEAGGLFRLLAADAKTAELSTVRRFSDPWEAEATRRLRDRDSSVLAEYQARGRVRAGGREQALDAAHQAWADARRAGRSVVVMAADHATVDQLALRARATRVAAGEVEAPGVIVGEQVVGVGDEVVTTLNNRRLVSTTGAWVRNGDRWQILARRPDRSLLLSSLDGRGKVSVPGDYVEENIALAFAVTVHKSQGLTVDAAVLVVGAATTAEHLYVGLTRGRDHNLACVVREPLDDGHRYVAAPGAQEVLAAALRRTGSEPSATETFRASLDVADDFDSLRAALLEAIRQVDALAGPDRSAAIERLCAEAARHAQAVEATAQAEHAFSRLSAERQAVHDELVKAHQAEQGAGQKRGWLRGPDRQAQAVAAQAADKAAHRLSRLDEHLQQAEAELAVVRRGRDELHGAAQALKEAEGAQQARRSWFEANPDVVAHLNGLARRAKEAAQLRAVLGPLGPSGPGRYPSSATRYVSPSDLNHERRPDLGL
ncbi:MAG: MobF family relaxase [Acidimicrobiales bacterium]